MQQTRLQIHQAISHFLVSLQSSDLKIAKQANLAFEALLDILKIQIDHAADFALPRSYAEKVMQCMTEVATFALGSGMRQFTPNLIQVLFITPVDGCQEGKLNHTKLTLQSAYAIFSAHSL